MSSNDASENRGDLEERIRSLEETLAALLKQRTRDVRHQWDRSLPFADYFVDRWEKARDLGFGIGSSVYDSVLIIGDVHVGSRSWIGPFVILDGSGGLTIGDTCSISSGVQIYSHDTVEWAVSGGVAEASKAAVTIGSRCYIGPNTVISKGVTIGDGCVIGANSLVNKSIPAGSRAWGTPCRVHGPTDRAE